LFAGGADEPHGTDPDLLIDSLIPVMGRMTIEGNT
jgi:hypothetical protein